jgi:predicted  nucleic acid-binding Zn-ribbon protein
MKDTISKKEITFLWPILIALAGVVVAFTTATMKVSAQDERINDLKSNYSTINEKLDKINEKLTNSAVEQATIRNDIEYIKKAVIIVQDK